jgi:hypothetical protein
MKDLLSADESILDLNPITLLVEFIVYLKELELLLVSNN